MSNTLDALDIREPDEEFLLAAEAEEQQPVQPCAIAVLVSDHKQGGAIAEGSDRLVYELLEEIGFKVDGVVSVKSKKSEIRKVIETAVVGGVDLVVTVGGTGVGPRDKAPEATRAVIDQMVPGVAQAVRASGQACGAVDACTSRGICGVSGSTVIVNLAPSRAAIRDGVLTIAPLVKHLIEELRKYSLQ